MSLNIDDFWNAHKKLELISRSSNNQMRVLRNLFTQIKEIYVNFSNSLRVIGESFHKDINQDENSDEQVLPYYQYIGNQLLKISESHKEFSQDVESIILNPYTEFSSHIESTTRTELSNNVKLLSNLESLIQTQKKYQEDYYKQAKATEKLQDNFNKTYEDYKTEEQLKKANDKLLKSKKEVQEMGALYKKQIESVNQTWTSVFTSFPKEFKQFDDGEENKSYFTQNTISNLIKFFNNFYPKSKTESNVNVDEKLKEFNDKYKSKNKEEEEKVGTFQAVASPNLIEILKKQPLEVFLSYEAKKKSDELEIIKYIEKEEYTVIYGASNESDLQFIMNFIRNFVPRNQALESTPTLPSTDLELSTSSLESPKEKSEIKIRLPLNEEDERRFREILTNPANRKFLFESLNKQRDTVQNSPQIRLSKKAFNFLKEYLNNIVSDLFKENDYDTLACFLPLATKYYTLQNKKSEFLYHTFRNQSYWEKAENWSEFVNILFQKKYATEELKQKRYGEMEQLTSPLMNKIWKLGFKKISSAFDGQKPKSTISEKDIYTLVLQDVCLYLARLVRNASIASEILITMGKENGFGGDEIKQFLNTYQKHRDALSQDIIYDHKEVKRYSNQTKWKEYYHIYLALEYLNPVDLVHLLELNKNTRKLFKKKIYRTIFYNFGDTLTKEQRLHIWRNILEINQLEVDFDELHEKVIKPQIAIPTDRDDVIKMDVARSFTNHQNFKPEILEALLRGYALIDKENSYCQGMNYVMGFFYINLQEPGVSFKCFIRLMNWHIRPIFEREFKMLKLNFFKFNRIIELYLPDLFEHFKNEKIETSFFLPSWFITVFSNNFQYTKRSKLIEKIWDFFILDGFKVIFKTALLILTEYKMKFIEMKFDGILKFLRDIGKDEIFTNKNYFDVIEGKVPETEKSQGFDFVKNYGSSMKNLTLTQQLLKILDEDFEVFETQIPKLNNL